MTTPKIGKVTPVDVRNLWKHEARDFTSWLSTNLDALEDALGFGITLVSQEKRIDNSQFTVDIWGEDEDGNPVMIENQLEATDHKHLGQLITYITNMSCKRSVWITTRARQEHVNALNWLNEFSDKEFFLIELSAIRIGDSDPAPIFNLICKPDENVKNYGDEKKAMDEIVSNRRSLRTGADTLIVPAQKEGFDRVFLGESSWYSIRISKSKLGQIKYLAGYQVSPIMAITHVAEVASIVPSTEDPTKYKVIFKGPATAIKAIPLGEGHLQGPVYCTKEKLDKAKTVGELLSLKETQTTQT